MLALLKEKDKDAAEAAATQGAGDMETGEKPAKAGRGGGKTAGSGKDGEKKVGSVKKQEELKSILTFMIKTQLSGEEG